MRILFATTSGAGHFGPMEPVVAAAAAAGHTVAVAAARSFAPHLERAGFTHLPFDDSPPDELGAVFATLRLTMEEEQGNRTVAREVFGRINTRSALPGMSAIAAEWRPDVIVRENAEFSSYLVAEANGIPHAQVAVGLARFDNEFLPDVAEALLELGADDTDGLWRAPRFTMVPESLDDPLLLAKGPILRYRDPTMTVTDAEPLPDWWQAGPPQDAPQPLVYVSFGTVAPSLGLYPALYRTAIDALADLPLRVLVTIGSGSDPDEIGPIPPNVHVEQWWSQKHVMAHADAMVGHGGFGTTLSGLAAGRPMVILPLFADQPHNARRVEAIGAGIALRGGPAAAAELGDAVRRVVDQPSFADTAARVAAEMRALPAPSAAVTLLEQLAG